MDRLVYQIRVVADAKGFREMWPSIRPMLSPSFVSWIEDLGDEVTQTSAEYSQKLAGAGLDVSAFTDSSTPTDS